MPTALIIGFQYATYTKPLISALIDIYHAYTWCQTFHCDIHLLTDIISIDNDHLKSAVEEGMASPGLMTFYSTVKKTLIHTASDLTTELQRVLSTIHDEKLIIYYSGHGLNESMLLPDNTTMSFIDIRHTVFRAIAPTVKVLWILDCCNPNGLHLPFRLQKNKFVLSTAKISPVKNPLLLITSCEEKEKSAATAYGSVFSRSLFQILTKMNELNSTTANRNLRRLMGNISSEIRALHTGYVQTVSIYSSYIIDPVLWLWVGNSRHSDLDLDSTMSTILVQSNKSFSRPSGASWRTFILTDSGQYRPLQSCD